MTITTDATCSAPCWYAREPECRCSCGGAAHGVLLQGGEQPIRNRKLQGTRYVLNCVIVGYGAATRYVRDSFGAYRLADKGAPVRVHPATDAELARWPELAGYTRAAYGNPQEHPYLVWTRA